jgi:hypothetical protein
MGENKADVRRRGLQQRDGFLQIGRIERIVTIKRQHDRRACAGNAGIAGGAGALIVLPNHLYRFVERRQFRPGIVARAIVNDDQFEIPRRLAGKRIQKLIDEPTAIIAGDDHADRGSFLDRWHGWRRGLLTAVY